MQSNWRTRTSGERVGEHWHEPPLTDGWEGLIVFPLAVALSIFFFGWGLTWLTGWIGEAIDCRVLQTTEHINTAMFGSECKVRVGDEWVGFEEWRGNAKGDE